MVEVCECEYLHQYSFWHQPLEFYWVISLLSLINFFFHYFNLENPKAPKINLEIK